MYATTLTSALTGINPKTLHHWSKTGVFKASVEAHGTGSRRKYSFADLVTLRVMHELRLLGLPLERITYAADIIREATGRTCTSSYLVIHRDGETITDEPDLLARFQDIDVDAPLIVVNLVAVASSVRTELG